MPILDDVTHLVGHTPLVRLRRLGADLPGEVVVKLESHNPGFSVKDRIALGMVEAAEARGRLGAGVTLVEPTSGNTGIGLAVVCASRGYRLALYMPDTMSVERRKLLRALGAELVLTPGSEGMRGAIARAEARVAADPQHTVMLDQFRNPANPASHARSTAEEIWRDTEGRVDVFVAGVGTGGTLTGVGRVLKQRRPQVRVVAVEPESSAVLTGGPPGKHGIMGIGAGFVPETLDRALIDEVLLSDRAEAECWSRRLAAEEGILAGLSSGAALGAALRLAGRPELKGKLIVALLPDSGERYLSTSLYDGPCVEEER